MCESFVFQGRIRGFFCVHGTDETNAFSVSCQAHVIVWHQLEAHGLQCPKEMHNVHLDYESLWITYIHI
jgi:hypothetical protein